MLCYTACCNAQRTAIVDALVDDRGEEVVFAGVVKEEVKGKEEERVLIITDCRLYVMKKKKILREEAMLTCQALSCVDFENVDMRFPTAPLKFNA